MKRLVDNILKDGLRILALFLVRAYQIILSPFLGGACRFEPSCSQYAVEVLKTQKIKIAFPLIVRRLCRCHPFGGHGFDPAPHSQSLKERSFNS